jgi:hypothetical protein
MKICTQPFHVGNQLVPAGTLVDDDSPITVGRDAFFAPAEPVEFATAEPGGRRSTRRTKADDSGT